MIKRGQVAAFIIIGIVILLIVGSIIIVKKGYIDLALEKLKGAKSISSQAKPIEEFLQSCVEQTGKEGINLIALQGGYANLPEDNIPNTPFTPLGASFEIIEGSDLKVPLWFREKGNGIQELKVPSKQDIERELSNYVNDRFVFCLENLTSFSSQGFSISSSETPSTTAKISNKNINLEVNYPITIVKDNVEIKLEKHSASIDSTFSNVYEAAKEIITKEMQDTFLENKTLAVLIAYDPEIPFSGIDTTCSEKIWYKPDVIGKLKNAIFENTAAITVEGANANTKDELKYLKFDALETKRKNLDINFMYVPNWPTVVEINPSEGNFLRSNPIGKRAGSGAQAIVSSFLCLNDHRFVYDIKYPILITIKDDSGLIFQFATEVIIDNNYPVLNRQEALNIPDVDEQICSNPQKEIKVVSAVIDKEEKLKPLENVDVSFKCLPANCLLGTTDNSNEPSITAKVPLCFNGIIEGRKEGYFPGKTLYSSNIESENEVLVTLEQKYKKEVKIFVIDKETGETRKPYDTEQISFQFTNSLGYNTIYNYPGDENLELIAGDYKVNSYLIRNSTWEITTKKETIEHCIDTRASGLLGFFKTETHCEKTEIDPVELDYALTGGASFETSFTKKELSSEDPLELYILSDKVPGDIESMQKIQIALETNKDHPLFKYPKI